MNLTETINCKEEYTGELVNSKAVMGWEVLSVILTDKAALYFYVISWKVRRALSLINTLPDSRAVQTQ